MDNNKDINNKKNTKPDLNQKAIAIRYDAADPAPVVVAKGQGFVAEKILQTAEESGVRVHKDDALLAELMKTEIGAGIPPELYEVVAQVLIFISDLDKIESYKKHGDKFK